MYYTILLILCHFCLKLTIGNDCVSPPLECPNKNVTFWLYTRANEEAPHQIAVDDPGSIQNAPWIKDVPIKVLIHGYTGHKDFAPNTDIRPAYMKCCNYNIISVDYNPIAREPCYIEAVRNTQLVGICTAQLIDELVSKYNFSLELFHVIGFSLGGQTAGYVGSNMKSGKLDRITALDPAMPLFVTKDNNDKIDKDDAQFVDVVHTNCLEKGKLEASGHADYYANGCILQPGCTNTQLDSASGCSHNRAPKYFAESITTDEGFYASSCYSWIVYMIGWCEVPQTNDEILVGEYTPKDARGLYFFSTNSEPPYARGPSKKRQTRNLFNFF